MYYYYYFDPPAYSTTQVEEASRATIISTAVVENNQHTEFTFNSDHIALDLTPSVVYSLSANSSAVTKSAWYKGKGRR